MPGSDDAAVDDSSHGLTISEARRAAGLTERELGERLGLSLWGMDRLERGGLDIAPFVDALERHTGQRPAPRDEALDNGVGVAEESKEESGKALVGLVDRRADEGALDGSARLVLGSIAALVLIRLFTEVI